MVKCSKAEVRRLKTALRWKIPAAQRRRIQMVLLRESGMTQPAIAAAMGVSLSTVNRAHMAYEHGGIKALKPKPNGGRKHENMTLAEEKALLARFAKAAGAGEILSIHDLKAAYEKAIGHATSDSTVYNLLHRHGWRKLMPRPFHPKRDLGAQNAFKKTAFLMPSSGIRINAVRSTLRSVKQCLFLLALHYGGFQVRRSFICATTVCTACEHAQPRWAKHSSHTTSAPAHEDSPRRRIVRWLSVYFLVLNSRSRRQSSIKPPSCFVLIPATWLRSFARSTRARPTSIMTRSSFPMARSFC